MHMWFPNKLLALALFPANAFQRKGHPEGLAPEGIHSICLQAPESSTPEDGYWQPGPFRYCRPIAPNVIMETT
jgi:hypothetical protein